MNTIVLMGRLARDPETKLTSTQKGQTKVSRFPLVVKRNRTSKAFVVMITAYGNNAEFVEKYLEKRIKIALSGELVISQIKDEQTGTASYYTEVIMDNVEFAEAKTKKKNLTDFNQQRRGRFHSIYQKNLNKKCHFDRRTRFMRKYFLELFAIGLVDSEGRINTEHMTSDALMTSMKTMEELTKMKMDRLVLETTMEMILCMFESCDTEEFTEILGKLLGGKQTSKVTAHLEALEELLTEEEYSSFLAEYLGYLTVNVAEFIRSTIIENGLMLLAGSGGEEDGEEDGEDGL